MKKPVKIDTKKQRRAIYNKALKLVQKAKDKDDVFGLCIKLKELVGISFFDFNQPETDTLFPEFGNYIIRYKPVKYLNLLKKNGNHKQVTNKWRVKVLEGCIKLCDK